MEQGFDEFKGYDLLRCAIIRRLMNDYLLMKKGKSDPSKEAGIQYLRKFFMQDCGFLLIDKNIRGEDILKYLDSKCDNLSLDD